jgi:hypothetical protein
LHGTPGTEICALIEKGGVEIRRARGPPARCVQLPEHGRALRLPERRRLSPSQSPSVQAGTTLTYTVSVTNSDSSGCATSTFGLQASAPAATADGSYMIGLSATNTSVTVYTGSGSATYVIASATDLSITLATDRAPKKSFERIGIRQEKKDDSFVLANGERVTRRVGLGIIRIDKHFTIDAVVFAEPGDLALLGAWTLEGLNLTIDAVRAAVRLGRTSLARTGWRRQ